METERVQYGKLSACLESCDTVVLLKLQSVALFKIMVVHCDSQTHCKSKHTPS